MKGFDFLNEINGSSKKNLIRESDSPAAAEKVYDIFFVSRCLSYHSDCILLVNELNTRGIREFGLDNRMHFEFLLKTIDPRKRFSKWGKVSKEHDEHIELIQHETGMSKAKAREAIPIYSEDDFERIRKSMNKGGKTK